MTGANAVTINDSGAVTLRCSSAVRQPVRIDSESLPTGMAIPSARAELQPDGANRVVEPRVLAVVAGRRHPVRRQLDVRRRAIGAEAMLVIASATAIRAEAAASSSATGARSPIAIASPVVTSKPVAVTAASATGTCQRPTI